MASALQPLKQEVAVCTQAYSERRGFNCIAVFFFLLLFNESFSSSLLFRHNSTKCTASPLLMGERGLCYRKAWLLWGPPAAASLHRAVLIAVPAAAGGTGLLCCTRWLWGLAWGRPSLHSEVLNTSSLQSWAESHICKIWEVKVRCRADFLYLPPVINQLLQPVSWAKWGTTRFCHFSNFG